MPTQLFFLLLLALTLVVLILIELFFIPSFGLFGVIGGALFIGVSYTLISTGQWGNLFFFYSISIVLLSLGLYIFSKSKWIDDKSLSKKIDGKALSLPEGIEVGDQGMSKSRLALSGKVLIKEKIFEAHSEEGLIEENQKIFISRIENEKIYVKPIK